MKGLSTYVLFVAGAVARGTPNPQTGSLLEARDSFCGTDQYGTDWWCTGDSVCCVGDVTVSCMPADAGCCTTGYYCLSDETCTLYGDYQYCVYEDSGAEVTQTAGSESVGQTKAPDSSAGGDSSASTARVSKLWVLAPLFGAAIAWI